MVQQDITGDDCSISHMLAQHAWLSGNDISIRKVIVDIINSGVAVSHGYWRGAL